MSAALKKSKQTISEDSHNVTSSPALGSGPMPLETLDGQMILPCGPAPAPARVSSASGQRGGFSDKRHLWPAWFRLIRECAPDTIFGEQVSSKDGLAWFDVVSADLENAGYAIGAIDTCAASVGAPHIRQRLYFVGVRKLFGAEALCGCWDRDAWHRKYGMFPWERCSNAGNRSYAEYRRQTYEESGAQSWRGSTSECPDSDGRNASAEGLQRSGEYGLRAEDSGSCDTECAGLERLGRDVREWRGPGWLDPITARSVAEAGATRGYWNDCDWWYGRDEKYRPIGAGLFPLVTGASGRMGKLRGYGNALCAPQAQAFVEAYLETIGEAL